MVGADVVDEVVVAAAVVIVVKLSVRRLSIQKEVLVVDASPNRMGGSSTIASGSSGGRS